MEEAPEGALRPDKLTGWASELCVLGADSLAALIAAVERLRERLRQHGETPLDAIASALALADWDGAFRLAVVAKDRAGLDRNLEQALARLRGEPVERWSTRGGVFYSSGPLAGKVAFLFPGEGSQYAGMLADLAPCFDEVQQWLDFWHTLYAEPRGDNRTDIVFPHASELDDAKRRQLEARLHDMDVGSEAVFVAGQAIHAVLRSLGVEPDVMVGHSSGESAALAAAGAIPAETALELAEFIRELNGVYEQVLAEGKIATGALLAVGALPVEAVREQVVASGQDVVIAMDNCANQLVLYGGVEAIEAVQRVLAEAGAICLPLPFDRGYHTPAFAEVSSAFLQYYERIKLSRPKVPMYSCATASRFPKSPGAIRKVAAAQWSRPVRFRETIRQMHADGVGCFVEVGPSGNLTAFVNDILAGEDVVAMATNLRRRHGVDQLLAVLAQLFVLGRPVQLDRLFAGRGVAAIELAEPAKARSPGVLLDNTMPMLRFSDAERATLREWGRGGAGAVPRPAPTGEPDAAPAAESARGIDGDLEARVSTEAEPGAAHASEDDAAATARPDEAEHGGADARVGVMTDYFDVMRGFLAQQQSVVEAWRSLPAEATAAGRGELPFLDAVLEQDEDRLVAHCRLSLADAFMRSHVLSGRVSEVDRDLGGLACVPLMVTLEIMAEACSVLAGTSDLRVIENVEAFDWIALDDEAVTLEVHAEVLDAERSVFRARLLDGGNVAASADFVFAPRWQVEAVAPLRNALPSRWDGPELYSTGMFHGPVFQSVRRIAGWTEDGIDGELFEASLAGFFAAGETPELVLNPVLLDAVGQLAAYWVAQQAGTDFNCFPSAIGRIELYAPCPADLAGLTLCGRQQPVGDGRSDIAAARSWRFECRDAAGTPLFRVDGLVNVFFAVPHTFYEVRRDPLRGLLGHPLDAVPGLDVMLWEVPHYSEEFCGQSGAIFMRILAHALLSAEERAEWRALGGTVRRRREWLFGRLAIKEAVRMALLEETGRILYPSDVSVCHDERGAPFVTGWWCGDVADAPGVSLSHTTRACLVAVGAAATALGVDFESLGRIQEPDLMIETLTRAEREVVKGLSGTMLDERLLRLWCAKEAAAKFFGVGLQGRPEAFEVRFVDDSFEHALVACDGSMIGVDVVLEGGSVIAVASGEARGIEVH